MPNERGLLSELQKAQRTELRVEIFDLITKGDAEGLRALLQRDPEVAASQSKVGLSPVMHALYHRKPDLSALILETGYDPTGFEAAALGDVARLKGLVDAGPELLQTRSVDGFTLLHLACFFGHEETVTWLLEQETDVNATAANLSEVRPLHSAAAARSLRILRLLLENGADPDGKQHGGWTALHAAAMHGDLAMTEALLEYKADRTLCSDDGKFAEQIAREAGHDEVAKLLGG